MHRFYLPPEKITGSRLSLQEGDSHHAADVLRLREGENVSVLDGAGREFLCVVETVHRREVKGTIRETLKREPLPYSTTLIQAIPKGKGFDTILQKAAELGASRIIPLLSSRVVVHLDQESAETKVEKWRHIAIEAIKQCGSAWLPRIESPIRFADLLKGIGPFDISMLGFLGPGTAHPRRFFEEFLRKNGRPPQSIAIWVGPEGDFTPEEITAI